LGALDRDAIDAEVLFPNEPALGGTFFQYRAEADFELACVQTYNDQLAEWTTVSDRYVPLAVIPYLTDPEVTVKEIERAVGLGHRGITMLAEPSQVSKDLPHFNDPHWYPIWDVCQSLDVPIHWHASAGVKITMPVWDGLTRNQSQAAVGVFGFSAQAQTIPNLIFSGILHRFPKLRWVCAESGLGWVLYILEACDHEWERRRLWTSGMPDRPSDLFHRQIYVDFWFEKVGIELRETIGVDNIMWESDYPHPTCLFPDALEVAAESMKDFSLDEKRKIMGGNAGRIYNIPL
jgi:predicted TIM-barrel fold metal-dependent hydrolase